MKEKRDNNKQSKSQTISTLLFSTSRKGEALGKYDFCWGNKYFPYLHALNVNCKVLSGGSTHKYIYIHKCLSEERLNSGYMYLLCVFVDVSSHLYVNKKTVTHTDYLCHYSIC